MNPLAASSQVGYALGVGRRRKSVGPTPGMSLWLRADFGALNSASAPAANGDAVETWQDQSGNGYHWTQNNGSIAPRFATPIVNGKPAISWNIGVSPKNQLLSRSILNFAACTVFAVAVNTQVGSADGVLLEGASNTFFLDLGSTTSYMDAGGALASSAANSVNGWNIVIGQVTGSVVQIDGGSGSFGASVTENSGFSMLYMGYYDAVVSAGLTGYMAEILVYSSALNSTDIATTRNYLKAKYGL